MAPIQHYLTDNNNKFLSALKDDMQHKHLFQTMFMILKGD